MDVVVYGTNHSVFEKCYAVGNGSNPRVVSDNHDSATVLMSYPHKQFGHDISLRGIQRGGWLVGEDELGTTNDRPRDRHTLPFAAAQFRRVCLHSVSKAEPDQKFPTGLLDTSSVLALQFERQGDVLPSAQRGQEIVVLEYKTDSSAPKLAEFVRRHTSDCFAVYQQASSSRGPDTSQDLKKSALSATRRTHHQQDLAAVHVERYPANGIHGKSARAVGHRYVAQLRHQGRYLGSNVHVTYLNTLAASTLRTFLIESREAATHIVSVTTPSASMSWYDSRRAAEPP